MAHVIKDSMNHYAIELGRGRKNVICLVRYNGEIEFKTFSLVKMISDHEYHTNDGTYQFDKRWEPVQYDAALTGQALLEAQLTDLHRVMDSFENSELSKTDKAQRMLKALRVDPMATQPFPNTDNEEDDMSKKTKKSKAVKKASSDKAKRPSLKNAIRELFRNKTTKLTLAQLEHETGSSTSSILTALSDLRSEKYCGKGGLFILKRDEEGRYVRG